ncbi:tyrosine-type recombinase/integrase [Crassaminicella thermophila]|uniref:Tyrosine-type recombinase/integrase n=1 Tax=Crassaminicella thermophila TaxID=2599308 RepID=A0A5C0SEK0_CRATE|nr:tyrosine-type recombinase/integrase [Crassaminicella thermophila]QEK12167.1 tyrosine-type recombinase/integrase [Crassaminicella thermophila]
MQTSEKILLSFLSRLEREKTKNDYKRDINSFVKFIDKDFLEANFYDCKKYINDLNMRVSSKKLAISTAEKLYSQIYSFFNYLEENNYISYNHFKKISKPIASRNISKERIINWEELDKLISILKTYNLRDYSILMLIFTSGLTLNEAVNLKWNQFVIDDRGNIGIVFTTKYGKRYTKVHKDTWNLLQKYRNSLSSLIAQDSYVFLNNRGSKITGRWIRMVLKKACKEAALDREYTPRDLRHTLVAYTLKKGASSKQVKQQLGWSNENLAQRYLYTIQQLEDNAIDYLNFSLK